jgi:hydrogenase nickel incorporation protein HypB
MCDTCGCGEPGDAIKYTKPGEEHIHEHDHEHEHDGVRHNHSHTHAHKHDYSHEHDHHHHDSEHAHHHHDARHNHKHDHHHEEKEIVLERNILSKNNLLAEHNRGYFEGRNILAINLVSSPGSGKTTLLEKTITDLKKEVSFGIIEGDQQTMLDANRIDQAGAPVIQVNTGNGCHLDAQMIMQAVKKLDTPNDSILMIENVGNLVCPSLFDLGESKRVVIMSTTEGEDKPAKYPTMFQTSDLCIINKTDLLPYVDFDIEKSKEYALRVNPRLEFIDVSAKTGEGLHEWYDWLRRLRA